MSKKVKKLPLPSCPPTPDSKKPKREKVKLTAEQKAERRVQLMKEKSGKIERQLVEQQMEERVYGQGGPKALSIFRRWRAAIKKTEQLRQRLINAGVTDLT